MSAWGSRQFVNIFWPGLQRALGLLLIVTSLMALQSLPRWGMPITIAAASYLLALCLRPRLWIFLLPVISVALDLTPWTGRFLFNELDAFFWLTVSSALICARYPVPRIHRPARAPELWLMGAFLAVALITFSGWEFVYRPPLSMLSNPYFDPAYGYKVGKGLLFGALLFPIWQAYVDEDARVIVRQLWWGVVVAAFALLILALWERGTYHWWIEGWREGLSSMTNLSTGFRVILFSDMHTGGEVLDGFLIAFLVLSAYGAVFADRAMLRRSCAIGVFSLIYVILLGFTRATYATAVLALSLIVGLELVRRRLELQISLVKAIALSLVMPAFFLTSYLAALLLGRWSLWIAVALQLLLTRHTLGQWLPQFDWRRPAYLASGIPLMFVLGLTSDVMEGRMDGVVPDLDTRFEHWSRVIELSRDTPATTPFGHGAGAFPAMYHARYPREPDWLGDWKVIPVAGETVLTLTGGDDLMVSQRLALSGDHVDVAVVARSELGGTLDIGLCARNVLDTGWRGGRCDRQAVSLDE